MDEHMLHRGASVLVIFTFWLYPCNNV